jgi:glycosyltransferase involved in cell wall biosynthesis
MKKYPKISIITPSYNQAEFLERTIRSVISQNYKNLEYIIIDGGSTDGSQKIIKKYKKYISFYISEKDNGQADAINKGFAKSTGEIMGWLNSDDILLPNSLKLISSIFSKYKKIKWITSKSIIINDNDTIINSRISTGYSKFLIKLGFYHGKLLGFIPQEGTFWHKKLWIKANEKVEDKNYCMDYSLWKKFANFENLVNVEAGLAAFRINPNQKTHQINNYYKEIHPWLMFLPNFIAPIGKFLNYAIIRNFSPRIIFDKKTNQWKLFLV